jgi:hypothetical protein
MHFEDSLYFGRAPLVECDFYLLCGITVLRFAWFRSALIGDLIHHTRGVTFLTTVAGTAVLGVNLPS